MQEIADRDSKNRPAYNEYANKRTRIIVNQRMGSRKRAIFGSHICKIPDNRPLTSRAACVH